MVYLNLPSYLASLDIVVKGESLIMSLLANKKNFKELSDLFTKSTGAPQGEEDSLMAANSRIFLILYFTYNYY